MTSFEKSLEAESAAWVNEGLITDAQRGALLRRYPISGGGTRFVGIVATLGGLLVAVGISLVIKANWQAIGDWTKIGGTVTLLVAAYATGWRLKSQGHFAKTGEVGLMVGQFLFLCGIALVSQIFHLNSRPATGVLLWWTGIVLVPWLARAKGPQFISIGAGLVWFGMEMTTPGSWLEALPGRHGHGHDEISIAAVFFLLGLALWGSGLALRGTRWSEFAGTHEKCGVLITGGALYTLGFARHVWDGSLGFRGSGDTLSVWMVVAVAGALAVAAFAAAWRTARTEVRALTPWLVASLVPVLVLVMFGPIAEFGWLWSAVVWVVFLALSIGIVRVGLETGREGWVNLGIVFIAVNVITRYFDVFGTMFEGGVFFIATGVIVTSLGIYLERKRRSLVAAIRGGSGS